MSYAFLLYMCTTEKHLIAPVRFLNWMIKWAESVLFRGPSETMFRLCVLSRWVCSWTVSPWRFTFVDSDSQAPAVWRSTWRIWWPQTSWSACVFPYASSTLPAAPCLSVRPTANLVPLPFTSTCMQASCSWATSQQTGGLQQRSARLMGNEEKKSNNFSVKTLKWLSNNSAYNSVYLHMVKYKPWEESVLWRQDSWSRPSSGLQVPKDRPSSGDSHLADS